MLAFAASGQQNARQGLPGGRSTKLVAWAGFQRDLLFHVLDWRPKLPPSVDDRQGIPVRSVPPFATHARDAEIDVELIVTR
jgi:hypothetical protein